MNVLAFVKNGITSFSEGRHSTSQFCVPYLMRTSYAADTQPPPAQKKKEKKEKNTTLTDNKMLKYVPEEKELHSP